MKRSNNTNKLSPQERNKVLVLVACRSNNTNKLSPQEPASIGPSYVFSSNNTNKLSPQELSRPILLMIPVQIIQINLVLKNVEYLQR